MTTGSGTEGVMMLYHYQLVMIFHFNTSPTNKTLTIDLGSVI